MAGDGHNYIGHNYIGHTITMSVPCSRAGCGWRRLMSNDVCRTALDLFAGMCVDKGVDMCADMCSDKFADMCVNMGGDMVGDMCGGVSHNYTSHNYIGHNYVGLGPAL